MPDDDKVAKVSIVIGVIILLVVGICLIVFTDGILKILGITAVIVAIVTICGALANLIYARWFSSTDDTYLGHA